MSYFRRRGMGDTAITDPCQVDPTIPCGSGASTPGPIIATVSPNQVDCSQLAADSPFRQPGQPCAPTSTPTTGGSGGGIMDWFMGLVQPTLGQPAPATAADQGMSDTTKLLLLGGAAAAAYYYFGKKRR